MSQNSFEVLYMITESKIERASDKLQVLADSLELRWCEIKEHLADYSHESSFQQIEEALKTI